MRLFSVERITSGLALGMLLLLSVVANAANPTVGISAPSSAVTANGPITYTVTFSEAVTGFSTAGITLDKTGTANGNVGLAGAGTTYTVTISNCTGNGTLGITINANAAQNVGLEWNDASAPSATFTVDHTWPGINSISAPSTNLTTNGPVTYTVTFSENVTGFDASDIILDTTGSATADVAVGGANDVYTVTLSNIAGDGTICILIRYGMITDLAGNILSSWYTSAPFNVNGVSASETVWWDDAVPAGATTAVSGGDAWTWVGSNPSPYSGASCNKSSNIAGTHSHYFEGAGSTLAVGAGENLFCSVYLDPSNTPQEIMLEWKEAGSWEHRAYWGANLISSGTDGTDSRRYMGSLPLSGGWVKLQIPASMVGLVGKTLDGMALTCYNGIASWDRAGKIAGHTITASATPGGSISPYGASGAVPVSNGEKVTFTFPPIPGCVVGNVVVDSVSVGAVSTYTFNNVVADHTIAVSFNKRPDLPQSGNLLFSALADALPERGNTGNWSLFNPAGQSLSTIAVPTSTTINGNKWYFGKSGSANGYQFGGSYSSPIACNGASIIAVAKPLRNNVGVAWNNIVDIFYDRFCLGIWNSDGRVSVKRSINTNNSTDASAAAIPDGQATVLSLIAQSDGSYKTYANGVEIMNQAGTGAAFTSLEPDHTVTRGADVGWAHYINVGRNSPDGWTIHNGYIGDVMVYTSPLTTAQRQHLETDLMNKFGINSPTRTISASADEGGSIYPTGPVGVASGFDQTFEINPNAGFAVADVLVDGVSQGAITSYTFSSVGANHTISATFSNAIFAHYNFDDNAGTTAVDSSGNGRDATLNNGVTWAAGRFGKCVKLDGTNDYVSLPAGIMSTVDDFTVAGWVKLFINPAGTRIFDFGNSSNTGYMMLTSNSGAGTRFAITLTNNASEERIDSSTSLKTGMWQHFALTKSGATGILYIDGVEVGRNAAMTIKPSDLGATANNWIGRSQNGGDPYLNAKVDGFRVYNSALTPTQIYEIASYRLPTVLVGPPTGTGPISYDVIFSESVSGFSTAGVTLNTVGNATADLSLSGSGNAYRVTLSNILGNGSLGISVKSSAAINPSTDPNLASAASVAYGVGTPAATVNISDPSASITTGGPVTYTVTFSRAVTGFTTAGITLNATGTAAGTVGLAGAGTTYTVTISGITGDGTLGITVKANAALDGALEGNAASSPSTTFTVANTPPTVSISAPSSAYASMAGVSYTVTFSRSVTGFAAGDVTINKTGTADGAVSVAGAGASYTVTFTSISGDGTLGIKVNAAAAQDAVGNLSAASADSTTFTVTSQINGLLAYYKFDENNGSTANDSSGSLKDGTLFNGPTWLAGHRDNALSFDRVNDYVSVPDLGTYPAITIAGWLNPNSLTDWQAIMHCNGWTANDTHFIFRSSGKLQFSLNGNNPVDIYSNVIYNVGSLNTWKHVAVVYDSSAKSAKFYVDGVLDSTVSYTVALQSGLVGGMRIGSWDLGGRFFGGMMDDFRIYSRALNNTEVLALARPVVAISAPSASSAASGPVTYDVTFSEAVTGFDSSDITLNTTGTAGGSMGVAGAGANYTVTVSGITGDGTLGITVKAGGAQNSYGESNIATTSTTFSVDNTPPSVLISAPSISVTKSGPVTYDVTFSEPVTGITNADIQLNSTGTAAGNVGVVGAGANYTVTVSGTTGDGALGITVLDSAGQDSVGNSSTASAASTEFAVDNTAPTVIIGAPSVSETTNGPVTYAVTFSVAVTGVDNSDIQLNTTGTAAGTASIVGAGTNYTVTVSSISGDGTLGITIKGSAGEDGVGNWSAGSAPSATFAVDNTAPTVVIADPSTTISNTGPVTYDLTFSEPVTGITNADIQLNTTGTATGTVGIAGAGANYTVTISGITGDGSLGITVKAAAGQDSVGNNSTVSAASTTFTVDNTAPSVVIGAPSTALTNTGPVTYDITFDESVTGITNADIQLDTTGTASGTIGVAGSGANYTVTISGITGAGTLGITVMASAGQDSAGNDSTVSAASTTFTVNNDAPTVVIGAPSVSETKSGPVTFAVTFSAAVTGITNADIQLNSTGSATGTIGVVGAGTDYTVTVSGITGDGTLGITVVANAGQDGAGNWNADSAPSDTFSVDNTAPTVDIGAPSVLLTNTGPIIYSITFSEPVTGVVDTDIQLNSTGTASGTVGVAGAGANYTVTISGITGDGTLGITVMASAGQDAAGNDSTVSAASTVVTVDNTSPIVFIGAPSASIANTGPITYDLTFSAAMTDIDAPDIQLDSTGSAAGTVSVSGSGTDYTVTISGITGDGTLGITVLANAGQDYAGNWNTASAPSATFNVDNTAPTVVIGAPSKTITRSGPVTYNVTFSESVTAFTAADVNLNITGNAAGTVGISGSGTDYVVTISGISGDGTLGISIPGAGAIDAAGNGNAASAPSTTFVTTSVGPSVTVGPPSVSATTAGPVTFSVTFSEAVTGFTDTGVILNATDTASGSIAVTGSGTDYEVTVSSIIGSGTLGITIAESAAVNGIGNPNSSSAPSDAFVVDNSAPTVSISAPSLAFTKSSPVSYTVTFDESVTGFGLDDIILNQAGTATGTVSLAGSGASYTVTISEITGNGRIGISISAGAVVDSTGNSNTSGAVSTLFTVDSLAPQISFTYPTTGAPCVRNSSTIHITGTASDVNPIASVTWATSGGIVGVCTGTANWDTGNFQISEGPNTITITAFDSAGNSSRSSIVVTYCNTHPGNAWSGVTMVSMPIIPDSNDPKQMVGFANNEWFSYDSTAAQWVNYTNHASWFEPRESTPGRGFCTKIPVGVTPDPIGFVPAQDQPIPISLKAGWNLIGSPYIRPVTWILDDILVRTPSISDRRLSDASGIVDDYAWGYDNIEGEYYLVFDTSIIPDAENHIDPWMAYWIYAYQDCSLIMPPPGN